MKLHDRHDFIDIVKNDYVIYDAKTINEACSELEIQLMDNGFDCMDVDGLRIEEDEDGYFCTLGKYEFVITEHDRCFTAELVGWEHG